MEQACVYDWNKPRSFCERGKRASNTGLGAGK
jgi:hypothetical protein